jgi:predicted nucleic acid-binding protein
MMVLVDTTVWIDFFAGRSLPHVNSLELMISRREDICTCGIVVAEILRGVREDKDFAKVKTLLENLVFLPMPYSVFLRSAEIYRGLRKKGITIRNTTDCLIASVALENDVLLLHNDRDFIPIEQYFGLKAIQYE